MSLELHSVAFQNPQYHWIEVWQGNFLSHVFSVFIVVAWQASVRALKDLGADIDALAEPESQPKKGGQKGPRYIQPAVANFRRTKKGYALIRQEITSLLKLQAHVLPAKAMLDVDHVNVSFTYNGKSGTVKREEVLLKAPSFFDSFFVQIRNKIQWGGRVQSWLSKLRDEIEKNYRSKGLCELIWMINESVLTETKGHDAHEESSEGDWPSSLIQFLILRCEIITNQCVCKQMFIRWSLAQWWVKIHLVGLEGWMGLAKNRPQKQLKDRSRWVLGKKEIAACGNIGWFNATFLGNFSVVSDKYIIHYNPTILIPNPSNNLRFLDVFVWAGKRTCFFTSLNAPYWFIDL